MRLRLNYDGGVQVKDRMVQGKLKTLKKALVSSYQAATAILPDGREFRCLINPDKLKINYNDKIISIPFEDICLNSKTDKIEKINIKVGDVFTWKETNTDWIVYLQRIEEYAYFRAEIRKCDYEVQINDHTYKLFVRGPLETTIQWNQKKQIVWNDTIYTLELYITKNEETEAFFHRFTKVKINGKTWEVQTVDPVSNECILFIHVKEYFSNDIEEAAIAELKENENNGIQMQFKERQKDCIPAIIGDTIVAPYDIKEYKINNIKEGKWILKTNKAKIIKQSEEEVTIEITTGRSGKFDLIYRNKYEFEDCPDVVLPIKIKTFNTGG